MTSLFFELIQIAIGEKETFTRPLSKDEWKSMYLLATKHSLLGILFSVVEKLQKGEGPSIDILGRWLIATQRIENNNAILNKTAIEWQRRFLIDGFQSSILKGQGVATLYPMPKRRQCGDIDIWLDGNRKDIVNYLQKEYQCHEIVYHHAHVSCVEDVEIEVHFTPSWFYNPIINYRFQAFIKRESSQQFNNSVNLDGQGEIITPSVKFNVVYMLLHMYRHLFDEGIGLRQMMDYYYVLKVFAMQTEIEKLSVISELAKLRLLNFASAVMYVQKVVFNLHDDELYCQPSIKYGKFLLKEIMLSGNFGQYDSRNRHDIGETLAGRYVRRLIRLMKFVIYYPQEVLFAPFWRLGQYLWRLKKRYN